jgi:hypothetical protein
MNQMNRTLIYQGWRCTFDPARPVRERWQSERHGVTYKTASESALKKAIDAHYQQISMQYQLA